MVVRAQQRSTWLVLASLGASAGYAGFAATRARPTQAKRLDVAHAVPPHVTPRESENPLQPKSVYSRPPRVPSEYDLNLGTAIDTLRRDYPKLFVEKPDLSIFTPTVELFDPSGKCSSVCELFCLISKIALIESGTIRYTQVFVFGTECVFQQSIINNRQ